METLYKVTMSTHQFFLCSICLENTRNFALHRPIRDFNFLDNWEVVRDSLLNIKPQFENWNFLADEFLMDNSIIERDCKNHTVTLHLTKENLYDISTSVEDWHRFISGDTELTNILCYADNGIDIIEDLRPLRKFIIDNEFKRDRYGWSGKGCENNNQKQFIIDTYPLYRDIKHFFAVKEHWYDNVYISPTLWCTNQPEPIKIEEIETL